MELEKGHLLRDRECLACLRSFRIERLAWA